MKIDYHIYELKAKNTINSKLSHTTRQGALLRVAFDKDRIGYADCHPWIEIGDDSLEKQLAKLQNGGLTSLTSQSMEAALIDANARAEKINLFDGLTIPQSHYLIPNVMQWEEKDILQAISNGFLYYKVKLGQQLDKESPRLIDLFTLLSTKKCKVRFDFNHKLTETIFRKFLKDMNEYLQMIDFCEDPFNFDEMAWRNVQGEYQVALACDNKSEQALGRKHSANVIVIKPAVQNINGMNINQCQQRVVFTSYLDHPVGQLFAAYNAAKVNVTDICGLTSHTAYELNDFSDRLLIDDAALVPPKGYGIGFDDLLAGLPWISLNMSK